MKNSSIIDELLQSNKWLPINSIAFADGKMVLMDIRFFGLNDFYINPIADTNVKSYLKYNNKEYDLNSFDVYRSIKIGKYQINVGSGAGEEEGIIYVYNLEDEHLEWFFFLEESNPFTSVTINETGDIYAVTETDDTWIIPLLDPIHIRIKFSEA